VSDTFNVNKTNVQTVMLGVNYLFNWSPAPDRDQILIVQARSAETLPCWTSAQSLAN
jgi:hypothetical protein